MNLTSKPVAQQLHQHIEQTGKSQAQIARALGISAAALSSWLSGHYKGDNGALELKVSRYLKREGKRSSVLQIPTVATSNYKLIYSALGIAQEEYDIALITGAAGTGKTTAAKAYAKAHNAIYLKAHRGLTMHRLFSQLAELLELSTPKGLAANCAAISQALSDRDTLIIIDEAEYLSDNSLELLRQIINDDACCGLALIGLPKLGFLIRNMANDHEQLLSRVGVALKLDPIPRSDFDLLFKRTWPDLSPDLQERIYALCENKGPTGSSPSLRNCTKILARIWRACHISGGKPSIQMLDEASRLIMTKAN